MNTKLPGQQNQHVIVQSIASYDEIIGRDFIFLMLMEKKGMKSVGAQNCEGYFRLKLSPRTENVMGSEGWSFDYLHNNICYMRYAEVLLNYAEAVAMGGNERSFKWFGSF